MEFANPSQPSDRRNRTSVRNRHTVRLTLTLSTLLASAISLPLASADEPVSFNRDIRPILADKCFACHGFDEKKREAGLRLDTFEGATADHDGNRAIIPGDVANSELWKRVNTDDPDLHMPSNPHQPHDAAPVQL